MASFSTKHERDSVTILTQELALAFSRKMAVCAEITARRRNKHDRIWHAYANRRVGFMIVAGWQTRVSCATCAIPLSKAMAPSSQSPSASGR